MKPTTPIGSEISTTSSRQFNVTILLFVLGMFTVSFELFMVIEYQFKFKFCYFPFMAVIFFAAAKMVSTRRYYLPLGFNWAILWSLFIAVFSVLYQYELVRNIGYTFWLFFSLGMVWASVLIFDTREKIFRLVKLYIISFAFVASFGAVQFLIALAGYPAPLHVPTAWWTPWLPRINAFLYEPSYYAMYMLPGWVILAYCIEKRLAIVSPAKDKLIFALITVTSMLAASRSGWLLMLLYMLKFARETLQKHSARKILMFIVAVLMIAAAGGFWLYVSGSEYLGAMLRGEDASPLLRMMALQDTIDIFKQSPLIGYGLGGVSSAIAELHGFTSNVVDSEMSFSGMSIFAECLAASGIIGFFPFLFYMWTLMRKPFVLAKKLNDPDMVVLLRAVTLSFIFFFIKLQFNQNILRPYFWLNIAVLSSAYSVALRKVEHL